MLVLLLVVLMLVVLVLACGQHRGKRRWQPEGTGASTDMGRRSESESECRQAVVLSCWISREAIARQVTMQRQRERTGGFELCCRGRTLSAEQPRRIMEAKEL